MLMAPLTVFRKSTIRSRTSLSDFSLNQLRGICEDGSWRVTTLYTVAGAISALANTDPISRISAGNTPDGEISVGIRDTVSVTILVKDHVFATVDRVSAAPRAVMEFADIDLANGLFRGEVSTINELCKGRIRLAGMISMIDNVNRILDRVSVYLA